MFRRIVCATDFSGTATAAARYAQSVARTFHGKVELVHVWRLPIELADGMTVLNPEVIRASRKAAEEQLAAAAKALGPDVQTKLLEGEPDRALVEHAEKTHADLLVTGTRGRTGLAHIFLGSVAERIVRTSHVPVLTVPEGIKVANDARFAPKHILVPVDLETASREMLKTAVALAATTHGHVCAVYAWQMPFYFVAGGELARESEHREKERFDEWVKDTLRDGHDSVERIARVGSAGDVINEAAGEQGADLVLMATAGRRGVEHFLIGSVTERTLRTVRTPVLTYRRPPELAPAPVTAEGT